MVRSLLHVSEKTRGRKARSMTDRDAEQMNAYRLSNGITYWEHDRNDWGLQSDPVDQSIAV